MSGPPPIVRPAPPKRAQEQGKSSSAVPPVRDHTGSSRGDLAAPSAETTSRTAFSRPPADTGQTSEFLEYICNLRRVSTGRSAFQLSGGSRKFLKERTRTEPHESLDTFRCARRRNGPLVRRPALWAQGIRRPILSTVQPTSGQPSPPPFGRFSFEDGRSHDDLLVFVVPEEVRAKAEARIPAVAALPISAPTKAESNSAFVV